MKNLSYTYKEMMKIAKRDLTLHSAQDEKPFRIAQGNRDDGFYLICAGDRDYDTPFSISLQDFISGKMPAMSCQI